MFLRYFQPLVDICSDFSLSIDNLSASTTTIQKQAISILDASQNNVDHQAYLLSAVEACTRHFGPISVEYGVLQSSQETSGSPQALGAGLVRFVASLRAS
ncbi:hypothetical protein M378DRAFT_332080 [Amanita muscaria Koide BX008]|uniref:Uncharacterized protein n=1 Tax=Amanita muscaria (strain Koide BX008) TaxID=946122 RepID=A0A0C2SUS2_AMAMK|nr:hypothetical protein M378DRAFT_332080 [Amanita muscaria Koide BX008]